MDYSELCPVLDKKNQFGDISRIVQCGQDILTVNDKLWSIRHKGSPVAECLVCGTSKSTRYLVSDVTAEEVYCHLSEDTEHCRFSGSH